MLDGRDEWGAYLAEKKRENNCGGVLSLSGLHKENCFKISRGGCSLSAQEAFWIVQVWKVCTNRQVLLQ